MGENCRENNTGKMNDDDKALIMALAKARTEEAYEQRLEAIDAVNEDWAQWLDERKTQFSTVYFLSQGIRRWGKVTSNGVENVNSALTAERGMSIMHMMQGIVDYQRNKHIERKEQASKWILEGKQLTFCAEDQDEEISEKAQVRQVENIQNKHPIYKANVAVGRNSTWNVSFLEVVVNVRAFTSKCPC